MSYPSELYEPLSYVDALVVPDAPPPARALIPADIALPIATRAAPAAMAGAPFSVLNAVVISILNQQEPLVLDLVEYLKFPGFC